MCDVTSCQLTALQTAINYSKAQKVNLKLILDQVKALCCSLQNCSATTFGDIARAIRLISTLQNQSCPYLLVNSIAPVQTAILTGPTPGGATNPVTAGLGLGQVYPGAGVTFTASGTFNAGSDSVPFSGTALTAQDVAGIILAALDNYKCGIYSCADIEPFTLVRLSTDGAFNNVTVSYVDTSGPIGPQTFTGTPVQIVAAINAAFAGVIQASTDGSFLDLQACNGGNIAFSSTVAGYTATIFPSEARTGGIAYTGLSTATTYTAVGVVQSYLQQAFNYTFPAVPNPLSATTPVNSNATTTAGLLKSYCASYTDVFTFVCAGSAYLTINAPNVPLNDLIAELGLFTTTTFGTCDVAYLTGAVCNLTCLLQIYLQNTCKNLMEYYQLEKNLYIFDKYCTPAATACTTSVDVCELKKLRKQYNQRHAGSSDAADCDISTDKCTSIKPKPSCKSSCESTVKCTRESTKKSSTKSSCKKRDYTNLDNDYVVYQYD